MKTILKPILTLIVLTVSFVCSGTTITENIDGRIGNYPATLSFVMNMDKRTVTGYFMFKGSNVPVKGKISLSGTFKHIPDPEVPHYPLYRSRMNAKTSSGETCGSWDVNIDTRMSIVEGNCKINGRIYSISFDGSDQ